MRIKSKTSFSLHWPVGKEMKSLQLSFGEKTYNLTEEDVKNPVLRSQLLALRDVKIISFETSIEAPTREEVDACWSGKTLEKKEKDNVRDVVEKHKRAGRISGGHQSGGRVSKQEEDSSSGSSGLSE